MQQLRVFGVATVHEPKVQVWFLQVDRFAPRGVSASIMEAAAKLREVITHTCSERTLELNVKHKVNGLNQLQQHGRKPLKSC